MQQDDDLDETALERMAFVTIPKPSSADRDRTVTLVPDGAGVEIKPRKGTAS